MKGYMFVEGHGETAAAGNLIARLWSNLALSYLPWHDPIRWNGINSERGLRKALQIARGWSDVAALLVLRDEDDLCPKEIAPAHAAVISQEGLPFPTALVLLHREFEVLFLPCLQSMAGKELRAPNGELRARIRNDARYEGDYEAPRDVKGVISQQFEGTVRYKPSLDQLALTRMVDLDEVRASGVPCFGSLERGLSFLAANLSSGNVYPKQANSES